VICGWADTGSLGLVYFYDQATASEVDFIDIRN
jgi:hypothetical protein